MPRWPDNCEWCNQYINGRTYCITYDQELLNELFDAYNRTGPKGKAYLWATNQRDNEWPKAGDKRGEYCSQRCKSQAVDGNHCGKWHSRGWFW